MSEYDELVTLNVLRLKSVRVQRKNPRTISKLAPTYFKLQTFKLNTKLKIGMFWIKKNTINMIPQLKMKTYTYLYSPRQRYSYLFVSLNLRLGFPDNLSVCVIMFKEFLQPMWQISWSPRYIVCTLLIIVVNVRSTFVFELNYSS